MSILYPDTDDDYNGNIFDLEREGRCSLVLVMVRYTGGRSAVPAHRFRREAAWPGYSPFQAYKSGDADRPGPPQFALVPDWTGEDVENRTVETFEADPNFEVYYDPESIAAGLLELNYLPENVFARGYDDELREKVLDFLGIGYEGTDESQFREILREIAGVDIGAEEAQEEARDAERVKDYRNNPRADLVDAARILGHDDPEAEGKIVLANWLADQDPEAVRMAFEGKAQAARDINAGKDADSAEPLTADDVADEYEFDEIKTVVKAAREGTGEFSLKGADTESMAAFLVEDKELTEDEIDAYLTG